MKIVSLLPSSTEIICSLGLREQLVGVSHECDYPPSVSTLPKVTKTLIPHDAGSLEIDHSVRVQLQSNKALYSLNMEILQRLEPDLIVTQSLCDVCAVAAAEVRAAACALPGTPEILNLEPASFADVITTLRALAEVTGRAVEATKIVAELTARVEAVKQRTENSMQQRPRVVFLEWLDPPFNAGHWNPDLIEWAGGIAYLGNKHKPAETIDWETIIAAQPEVLFIACCGFTLDRTLQDIPILKKYIGSTDLPCVANKRIYVADGNAYFNRPGPRLVDSLEIIAHTLHADIHPLPKGLPAARIIPLH